MIDSLVRIQLVTDKLHRITTVRHVHVNFKSSGPAKFVLSNCYALVILNVMVPVKIIVLF